MKSVLTEVQANLFARLSGPDSYIVNADGKALLGMVDGLVAEVARLRARNEALERVAKAAANLCGDWDLAQFATPCTCGESMPGKNAFTEDARALEDAIKRALVDDEK